MPDNVPDEAGGRPPGGGSRRTGLDRLRAARGSAEEPTGADQSTPSATEPSESERRPTNVLLDEPHDRATHPAGLADTADITSDSDAARADTAASSDEVTPSEADAGRGGKGRRSRRRAAAAAAAGGTAASTATVADGPGRPRSRADAGTRTKSTTVAGAPASTRQKVAALLLGLIVIALLVPVVAMRHRLIGQTSEEKAVTQLTDKRTAALASARQFAVTFFSPDYKKIDDYNKQVLAATTGPFNQDFASKQADLKSLVTKAQSQATGRILAAGVSKVSGNDVEVLVVADQDVQNALTKGKVTTIRTRVRVTVHKTDKGWLVSGFEPVT